MQSDDQPDEKRPDPIWPRPGVSIAVFRACNVLLIERGQHPFNGLWSLPGGHVEPGEKIRGAALRELTEETGVTADLAGLADVCDVILHDANGKLRLHYVLSVFAAHWVSGEPVAASDSRDARFVSLTELARYRLTDGTQEIIERARRLAGIA